MRKIILFFLFIFLINTAFALETYTDEKQGFKMGYPSDWSFFKNYAGANLYLIDPYSYASVNVIVTPSGGMSLAQITDQARMGLNQMGIYPYDETDITINSIEGVEWKVLLTNYYTYEVYEEKQVMLLSGDKVYTITAASPQSYYSEYSDVFDQIMNSFDIITPAPKATISVKTPTPVETAARPSASVQLHGEKTDVVLGEDIILKLSAVNIITKPVMTVQVILIPPSGMSVTSSEFVTSGAGQYTTTYKLDPGSGKDIEVRIKTNQIGDFGVKGRVIYYYGEDKATAEDHTLDLPIKVRAEAGADQTISPSKSTESSTPGFEVLVAAISLLVVVRLVKRR